MLIDIEIPIHEIAERLQGIKTAAISARLLETTLDAGQRSLEETSLIKNERCEKHSRSQDCKDGWKSCFIDISGNIMYVNDIFLNLTGYCKNQLINISAQEVFHKLLRATVDITNINPKMNPLPALFSPELLNQ